MAEITTYNTLAIANKMKRVWKESSEYDAKNHVCNKLLYLFIDAMKSLDSTLTTEEILNASFEAHEATRLISMHT